MKYIYTAIIHEEDGTFYCRVPDIPGCITTGKNLPDAIEMITDALSVMLCTKEDYGDPISPPSAQADIAHNPGDICTLIQVDTLAYRALTDTRAIRKNVSIPAWMAARADKLGINCSKLLQDALMKQFA